MKDERHIISVSDVNPAYRYTVLASAWLSSGERLKYLKAAVGRLEYMTFVVTVSDQSTVLYQGPDLEEAVKCYNEADEHPE